MSNITYGGSKNYDGPHSLNITLAGQGTATGESRQSDMVPSNGARGGFFGLKYTTGTAAMQGNSIGIGWARSDGLIADDNAGTVDADITVNHCSIFDNVNTNTSGSATYYAVIPFQTPVPPYFAAVIQNLSLGTADADPDNFELEYTLTY